MAYETKQLQSPKGNIEIHETKQSPKGNNEIHEKIKFQKKIKEKNLDAYN